MALAGKKKKLFDGRYEVLSIVGRGSCSVVYQARHGSSPSALVALKVLLDKKNHGSNTDRLRKEALALVSARHKYVVRLDDFHSVGDLCYLSMEYAPESDMRKYAAKIGGRLSPVTAALFMSQAAEALDFVHQVGMVHRDIKPDNILVINDAEIRLADFGVAMLPGENPSVKDLQSGVGTMNYMAPEVLEGQFYDKRSDIYALGVTIYELVSGAHPFAQAALLKQLEIRQDGAFPHISLLVPEIQRELAEAVMRCMAYRGDDRFGSAREIVEALAPLVGEAMPEQKAAVQVGADLASDSSNRDEVYVGTRGAARSKTRERVPSLAPDGEHTREERGMSSDWDADKSKGRVGESGPKKSGLSDSALGGGIASDSYEEDTDGSEETGRRRRGAPRIDQDDVRNPTQVLSRESVGRLVEGQPPAGDVPRKKRREITKEQQSELASKDRKRRVRVAAACGISMVILYFGSGMVRDSIRGVLISGGTEAVEAPAAESIPAIQVGEGASLAGEVAFPLLPSGLYSGTLDGFLPNEIVSLTMMSLADKKKLVVILGVEGWSPKVVDLEPFQPGGEHAGSNAIRVAANGFVLDFAGQKANDEIVGTFKNTITGEQGEWKIAPSR